jgi:hypothetical protein
MLYGVTKVFSSAYHSRGQETVERLNRTIEDSLKHTTNQACNDWDVWLPEAFSQFGQPLCLILKSFFPYASLYGRDPIILIDNALFYPQSSSSVAQAEEDRTITYAADHIRAASNMARYHKRMQQHFNASHTPTFLSKGDLIYAHKPDAKRRKFGHTCKCSDMIVRSHLDNNNYILQTFIDQKVHRITRNINY